MYQCHWLIHHNIDLQIILVLDRETEVKQQVLGILLWNVSTSRQRGRKAQQTSQLKEKRRAAQGGIRTHNTAFESRTQWKGLLVLFIIHKLNLCLFKKNRVVGFNWLYIYSGTTPLCSADVLVKNKARLYILYLQCQLITTNSSPPLQGFHTHPKNLDTLREVLSVFLGHVQKSFKQLAVLKHDIQTRE